ncbi:MULTISPECIES: tetratricopeptide repeat protein [unclassified Snodgrassella]|uniref:tetratricopeptide repeat protein n=1 Tax=unclassified Snodgrassella TaxID=2625236 RepID=UPI0018DD65FF|nr:MULTISPECIES: tetratricopeptide repeat protein [unclassified Snodgrassella]MBI0096868.1 tetratricopeptide repeat protein [Snodgrassella sp. W8134]MBI0101398.1 tetratricopeptide repeat protein [Snodgrassella sp. W8135]MBI0132994.1 tetratricopeptide repeat protein [Snodgrassella sp. W8132]
MPRWIHRITPIVLSLMAVHMANANSVSEQHKPVPLIQTKIERINNQVTAPDDADSLQRRLAIAGRANDIFTLFATELIYSQGKTDQALAADMRMLEHTQEPDVAERAMEMALGANKITEAQTIANRWQQIEPTETPARQRLMWELAIAKNDVPQVLKNADAVLSHANDYQLRRLFLKMAQFRLNNLDATDELNAPIHKTAVLHPEMAEALIADAIYGATGAHKEQTIKALQLLVHLDTDIFPASQLTLNLINLKQPQYLLDFYQLTGVDTMPAKWQSLYIELLIKNNQLQQAYQTLQPLLEKSKSADLYLQAVYLAVSQKAATATIAGYAEKIVELGNSNQRSKAAMMVAMRYYDEHNLPASRSWATKVNDPQFLFDQALMMCSIEAEQKHWKAAQQWLNKVQTDKTPAGTFFSGSDLLRLQTFVNSSSLTDQKYEQYLNRVINEAEHGDTRTQVENVAPLLLLRGLLYADKFDEPAKAVADLRRFVKMRPNQIEGLNALGYTLLSLSKDHWQEAQQLLEQAYAQNNQSPAINDSLGWAYFLNGNVEKALPLLEYAYQKLPESEVAAHLGEVYWQQGREDEARQIWAQGWLNKASDHKILNQILSKHQIRPNSLPLATAKKVETQADADIYLQQAGILFSNRTNEPALIENINKVIQTGNRLQQSQAALLAATYYFSNRDMTSARKWLDKVTDSELIGDKAYLMGMIEVTQNNIPAAKQWLARIDQNKESPVSDNMHTIALSVYIDSKTLDPKVYVQKLTQMLKDADKKAAASEDNNTDLKAFLLYSRATAYSEKLDQPKKAIKDIRAFIELKPDDAEGYNGLGYTMLSMPKRYWAEALSILQHASQLDNESWAIQDSLGWAYYLNNQPEKALPLLRSAYQVQQESAIAAHLGEVLWQQGEQEQARKIWAQGLANKDSDQKELQQILKKFNVNPSSLTTAPKSQNNK